MRPRCRCCYGPPPRDRINPIASTPSEWSESMYPDTELLIDGKWGPAAGGKKIPVLNPATEEVIGHVAHAEKADLDRALAAADKAFNVWRKVAPFDRYKVMRKAADLIRSRADEIGKIMTMEQ